MSEQMRIVIAYDGSSCADAALDDLKKSGLPGSGIEATVISVAEVWLPPPPPSSYEIVDAATKADAPVESDKKYARSSHKVDEARALSLRAQQRLENNFPQWVVSAEAKMGSPAWEIIWKADESKADLIVVGSQGRSALGRLVLGSVSQKILTEARSSVRIARGKVEVDDSPVRIIIGVDGSPGSEAAVNAVASRSWPPNTEVRVIIVEEPLIPGVVGSLIPSVAKWVQETNESEMDWTRKLTKQYMEALRSENLKATSSVMTGDPKRVFVEEAEKWGADTIFLGSTGFSNRLQRFLLGSVSAAVAARAHCSVEVVRVVPRNA